MWKTPASSAAIVFSALTLGAAAGLGGFTFIYAEGASYLTNAPAACANCHVMREHYDAWVKSSHRSVAVCNDCHTPPGFFTKYAAKATNGYDHSLAFITGNFSDPIRIKVSNRTVAEANCRRCHEAVVDQMDTQSGTEPIACLRCHNAVGHMP